MPDVFEEQWDRIVIFLDLTMAFGIYSPFAFGNIFCPLPLETVFWRYDLVWFLPSPSLSDSFSNLHLLLISLSLFFFPLELFCWSPFYPAYTVYGQIAFLNCASDCFPDISCCTTAGNQTFSDIYVICCLTSSHPHKGHDLTSPISHVHFLLYSNCYPVQKT